MASSFTTNYGFEEIATGEQSGAWGTTTNFNYDILDRISAYKAVALSGSSHTLTVREASPGSGTENLQDGMFRVIRFTGALGANNTVTIAPNTTTAYFLFINATTDAGSSGPYSVIISQGSGANITIVNGAQDLVYCNGAGSGAIVYSFFAGGLTVGGLTTAAATITGGSVTGITDLTVADGGTGASSFTDGGILLGSGTSAITATAVLTDGQMIVGDGTGDPAIESGATLRTSIGLGTMAVVNTNAVPAQTLNGAVTGADQIVSAINLKDYGEVTQALGSAGGTRTVNLNNGNSVTATVSASANTFVFSNPTAGDELCGFTLGLTNGGSQTVNWPSTVDWTAATAPTLTASGVDWLVFWTVDGGTIWNGKLVGAAFA